MAEKIMEQIEWFERTFNDGRALSAWGGREIAMLLNISYETARREMLPGGSWADLVTMAGRRRKIMRTNMAKLLGRGVKQLPVEEEGNDCRKQTRKYCHEAA